MGPSATGFPGKSLPGFHWRANVGGPEDGDIEVTAVFEPDAFYALTLLEDGEGTAEASAPLHTEGYGLGESIVLEATPDPGWAFSHWLDNTTGNVISYRSPYGVKAKETNSYTAVFRALNTLTLTTVGQGHVHRMTNSLIYEEDASVTLTPVPSPGWKFTGWTGDVSGTDNPLQVVMDAPKAVTATFAPGLDVCVDINDDGDPLNDEVYEPGSSEESTIGELMRTEDALDNGAGHGTDATYFYGSDDLQRILFHAPDTEAIDSTLTVSWEPSNITIQFYRDLVISLFDPHRAPTEVSFPLRSVPDKLYMSVQGGVEEETEVLMTFRYEDAGLVSEDPIRFTIVSHVGDPHYFHAARDYILENDTRVFLDQATYGDSWWDRETMNIVVMRQEATTMTALDAYRIDPRLKNIYEVVASPAGSGQSVVVNGNFVYEEASNFATRCHGLLVISGSISDSSTYEGLVQPEDDRFPPDLMHSFVGQKSDGTFVFKKEKVEDDPQGPMSFANAMGGVFGPTKAEVDSGSYDDKWGFHADTATIFVGEAPAGDATRILFVGASEMTTLSQHAWKMAGTEGLGRDLFASGATHLLFLDGGSSEALAARKSSALRGEGVLAVIEAGGKHSGIVELGPWYSINNYLMFYCERYSEN